MTQYVLTGDNKSYHLKIFALFIFLGILVTILDSFTPLGYGEWVLYLVLLVIYRRLSESDYIIYLAWIYVVFISIGYFLSPPGLPQIYSIANRIAAITTTLLIGYISGSERDVKKINSEILERISDSFLALDTAGNITYLNKTALTLAHRDELLGKNIWKEFPAFRDTVYYQKIQEALKKQVPVEFNMQGLQNPFMYNISVYPSSKGISVFSKNITEVQKAEEHLRKTLKEKELLLREIHHRVKNNFQLISSLMGLSSHGIQDEKFQEIIKVIQQRIRTLATIHEKLYQSANIESIGLKSLIEDLLNNFGPVHGNYIGTEISADNIHLDIQNAIPVGCIITELFTNSVKHAFSSSEEGKVSIQVRKINANSPELELIYKDNGKGMPADFNIHNCESLGFTIITSFVEQLNGHMSIINKNGAEFRFIFRI
jgi:PAS domain S-box-containing protein